MTSGSPVVTRELLTAIENAPPAAAIDVVAAHLRRRVGSDAAAFWIADAAGQALLRLPDGQRCALRGTAAGTAWLEQRVLHDESWWLPVTARGDALGVLEVRMPPGVEEPPGLVQQLAAVAHLLAYIVAANQRHTDEYETARRSQDFELAMEIQRRLLPQSFVCEGGSFTVAGWLEPSSSAGGDTFDYVVSRDRFTLAMIDAVGHDVEAAMLATLTVNAMRNARRGGGDLVAQVGAAHTALTRYGDPEDYATAVVIEVDLGTAGGGHDVSQTVGAPARARLVNAGHPPPLLIRDGSLTPVDAEPDPPLGLLDAQGYAVVQLDLRPGDRVVLLTDGMYERMAETFDLGRHLLDTVAMHPRNAAQVIARAFREHLGGVAPEDDASFVLLDWLGGSTTRRTDGGADHVEEASD